MRRRILPFALAGLLAGAMASGARVAGAHGGQYRPGGGYTPLPPPTGMPSTPGQPGGPPPPTTPGIPPTHGPTTPHGPDTDPTTTPPPPRAPARRGSGRTGPGQLPWQEWWEANEAAIRSGRRAKPYVTEDNPLFRIGGGEKGNRSDAERPARRAVETEILPALRALADDPNEDADVVASSLLAIAKTTQDEADVRLLLRATARAKVPALLRETAWIALGCLRRSRPEDRFPAATLDRVRDALFQAVDDKDGQHLRARCFAAFALGLLGDQPSGDDEFSADARQVVRGLWVRLQDDSSSDDLPVALLVALSMQPPRGVPDAVKDDLRGLLATGRLGRHSHGKWMQAHAALALARLTAVEHEGCLLAVARSKSFDAEVRRSAALGLSVLAPALAPEARAAAAAACAEVARSGDPDTAGVALLASAGIVSADFEAGSSLADERAGITDLLGKVADAGAFAVRPYGALALALATHDVPGGGADDLPAFAAARRKALDVLRANAADATTEVTTRAAFCLALGIAGDERSAPLLRGIVAETSSPEDLRAYACAGLGLLGRASPEVRATLLEAAKDASSESVRRAAARALGLLGDTTAAPLFLTVIERGGPDHVLARAAQALGDVGDAAAARRLAALARDKRVSDLSRAIACAALGLLGDREPVPSLSRLGADVNWLALTDALSEALSLL